MNKIKTVSRLFRIIFQIAFVLLPIVLIAFWLNAPALISLAGETTGAFIGFIPKSIEILHPLSATTKTYGLLISLIPYGIVEMVLYFLIKLFRSYEHGEIFSLRNVNYIRNMGYVLLIGQLLNPIYELLMTANLTWQNPPGHRVISITFGSDNVGVILLGLLIILISWIMAEGWKLLEEQQHTI